MTLQTKKVNVIKETWDVNPSPTDLVSVAANGDLQVTSVSDLISVVNDNVVKKTGATNQEIAGGIILLSNTAGRDVSVSGIGVTVVDSPNDRQALLTSNSLQFANFGTGSNISIQPETPAPSGSVQVIVPAENGTIALEGYVDGIAANKADLVGGKVPASQLPAYVDDVVEYANLSAFPVTGESGKLYVALDTNLVYRWSGTVYVEISPSPDLSGKANLAGGNAFTGNQTVNGSLAVGTNTPISGVIYQVKVGTNLNFGLVSATQNGVPVVRMAFFNDAGTELSNVDMQAETISLNTDGTTRLFIDNLGNAEFTQELTIQPAVAGTSAIQKQQVDTLDANNVKLTGETIQTIEGIVSILNDLVVDSNLNVTNDITGGDLYGNNRVYIGATPPIYENEAVRKDYVDSLGFSFDLNPTTTPLSSVTLNTDYASNAVGYEVICPDIVSGALIYKKTDTSKWHSTPITAVV